MNTVEIGNAGSPLLKYRYIVGDHTVGIIPPSRKKHVVSVLNIRAAWGDIETLPPVKLRGSHDDRVRPEEIVNYILQKNIR